MILREVTLFILSLESKANARGTDEFYTSFALPST